eukprot:637864-Amphidinium_carterae.2
MHMHAVNLNEFRPTCGSAFLQSLERRWNMSGTCTNLRPELYDNHLLSGSSTTSNDVSSLSCKPYDVFRLMLLESLQVGLQALHQSAAGWVVTEMENVLVAEQTSPKQLKPSRTDLAQCNDPISTIDDHKKQRHVSLQHQI